MNPPLDPWIDRTLVNPYDEITPGLYIGDIMALNDDLFMSKIDCVINLSNQKNLYPEQTKVYNIDIFDHPDTDISKYLDLTFDLIKNSIENDDQILVHCIAGQSRSPTIVIHYLMKINDWSYETALEYTKSKRSIVCPNAGFVKALTFL